MPEYINHNGYTVHLTGPDGRIIRLASQQRMTLSPFFEQYRARGLIKLISESNRFAPQSNEPRNILPKPSTRPARANQVPRLERTINIQKETPIKRQAPPELPSQIRRDNQQQRVKTTTNKPVVGKQIRGDATEQLKLLLQSNSFAISNDIGVGVLSYNRAASLRRCISSIIAYTNLLRTTVFISDDGSTDPETLALLDELALDDKIIVIKNKVRLGIAGNTNRLLRCLQRFKYGLLLNDDVEVLAHGWDSFYFDAMIKTGYRHFIHRQPGIYGAQLGKPCTKEGVSLTVVDDKPQGAILAFSTECIKEVGYFDESFGLYGMEHVDWSTKVHEHNMQPIGFYDVVGSLDYFRLHAEQSVVDDRNNLLRQAREKFNQRSKAFAHPSAKTIVDSISVVIPYRELQRNKSLSTVINNMKALRIPDVEIVLVEQDESSKVSDIDLSTVSHYFVPNGEKSLFNKSMAFNKGVHKALHNKILMHDADILTCIDYGPDILKVFNTSSAFHIGQTVLYANPDGSNTINNNQAVEAVPCDRIVGYFEGGSLAATKSAYWSVGGFNEAFYGYGCEDCDFFARLASLPDFFNTRSHKFLHLWHPRAENWDEHHDVNRAIERKLCATPMHERINQLKSTAEKYNENINLS